ncbi:DNA replication ATP-dependent helicase/nuclease DNA2 [Portunus trituberculatus]|uniref:DNA replication ATP-dependent helicase/nuclease n=1 Tax=Portunus trituberculatus TaxID=210409 RepID=A0A5B7EU22_PORTR|nr:DNA replication ATP-dependent helicase/nuclease DNA2 [Portunus trituberculatus]
MKDIVGFPSPSEVPGQNPDCPLEWPPLHWPTLHSLHPSTMGKPKKGKVPQVSNQQRITSFFTTAAPSQPAKRPAQHDVGVSPTAKRDCTSPTTGKENELQSCKKSLSDDFGLNTPWQNPTPLKTNGSVGNGGTGSGASLARNPSSVRNRNGSQGTRSVLSNLSKSVARGNVPVKRPAVKAATKETVFLSDSDDVGEEEEFSVSESSCDKLNTLPRLNQGKDNVNTLSESQTSHENTGPRKPKEKDKDKQSTSPSNSSDLGSVSEFGKLSNGKEEEEEEVAMMSDGSEDLFSTPHQTKPKDHKVICDRVAVWKAALKHEYVIGGNDDEVTCGIDNITPQLITSHITSEGHEGTVRASQGTKLEENLNTTTEITKSSQKSGNRDNDTGASNETTDMKSSQESSTSENDAFNTTTDIKSSQESRTIKKFLDEGKHKESYVSQGSFGRHLVVVAERDTSTRTIHLELLSPENGLVVVHPDLLVSSTSVAAGVFCRRRAVLAEWHRGMEPPSVIMTVGSLVHELFQEAVVEASQGGAGQLSEGRLQAMVDGLLGRPKVLEDLYRLNQTVDTLRQDVAGFIPKVLAWCGRYLGRGGPGQGGASYKWQGRITHVEEVEENIWCPRLGLKGKVDLVVQVEGGGGGLATLPLELKTGRASFSPEHCGQLALGCQQCPHKVTCAAHQVLRGEVPAAPHPMADLVPQHTAHLSPEHLDYFRHWCLLHQLEAAQKVGGGGALWCRDAARREEEGECLAWLVLATTPPTEVHRGCFLHTLVRGRRHPGSAIPLASVGLQVGSLVIASSSTVLALACGTVKGFKDGAVLAELDRPLQGGMAHHYHLDLNSSTNFLRLPMQTLGKLLLPEPRAEVLRRLVVDRGAPAFKKRVPSRVLECKPLLAHLNTAQKRAVIRALAAEDYMLVQGFPGTGKSTMLATMVRVLLQLGRSVLITAYTNTALDSLLLKLHKLGIDFMRVGRSDRVHPDLASHTDQARTSQVTSVEQLTELYAGQRVVAATCLGLGHCIFSRRTFDVCIVDEAAQVQQVAALGPLFLCSAFVLVGDDKQLPPVVSSESAALHGMAETLFERLCSPPVTVTLTEQYRMNGPIMTLANLLTYNNQLTCATPQLEQATLDLPHYQVHTVQPGQCRQAAA